MTSMAALRNVIEIPLARQAPSWTPFAGAYDLVTRRIRLRRGEALVRNGAQLGSLHAIRSGSCKSVVAADSGEEQVAGYHIAGEVVGAEAIATGVHMSTIIALEDSEFLEMPRDRIVALARKSADFQQALLMLLAEAVTRGQNVALVLGVMRAEQRVAWFLLDIADRYAARGYSSSEFALRMTREEIGSHLGLTQETVSRLVTRFQQDGVISAQGRHVRLLDRMALRAIVNSALR